MREEQAALLAASQEVRAAAQVAREQARATVRAAAETRRRLGTNSLELRVLAVRRLVADGGPDAAFWVSRVLESSGRTAAEPTQAASETARSAAPTSRA